ncbi:MAG: hypothetical protein HY298_07655 [Verrucomicrobia bacterium]|nr:hypothetical protein [Verrucomicrobiota bacterium]
MMQEYYLQLAVSLVTLLTINASAAVLYVDVNSTNATPPYTNWSTAAVTIQDAVDAAVNGDQVLVTNGVYRTGGRLSSDTTTNRVAVTKAITVQSINGPAVTVIEGYQVPGTTNGFSAVRCVYLANGAALLGFTLTNGATGTTASGTIWHGGGILFQTTSIVSNCVLTCNSADAGGGGAYGGGTLINCSLSNNWARLYGGGAYGSTLNSCTLIGNATRGTGGGALGGTLNNCLIVSNSAGDGGGVYSGTLNNCTVIGNTATSAPPGPGRGGGVSSLTRIRNCVVYFNIATNPVYSVTSNYWDSPLTYCCSGPLAAAAGNITNAPLFADQVGGDYHLQSNSPCINAGKNAYATNSTDLDGDPRIVGSTVDIGAYEFQTPSSILSYAWAQQYSLPTDGSADYLDSDSDFMNNWQEWIAGTDPTNSLSVLRLLNPTNDTSGVAVSWQSVSGRSYWLERATDLGVFPAFSLLRSNITGQIGTTSYTDTNAIGDGPFFYRVGVQQ